MNMISQLNSEEYNYFMFSLAQITCQSVPHITKYVQQLKFQLDFSSSHSHSSAIVQQPKQIAAKVLKSQALLRAALAEVCRDFGKPVSSDISDRELCLLVNKIVEGDQTQKFWNRVAIFEPSKTKKQLYDFYHTSFQKALFDQKITREDKKIIEHMNRHNPDVKPAQLADMYIFQSKKHILKREVVRQFANLRRIKQLE
ncbi:Hypothetical_protein [Hexamita inflata]|uniref:Hypothetical_protein n=1 Tax=Hexamita inflata TaxID=28002 RepID=A0AA86V5I6_9EUKA|nr:Hypothetical protein HINF_LOCUS64876 [Hexamita inflata]